MVSKIIPAMFLNVGFNGLICTKQKYMKRSYVFSFLLLISLIARKAKNNNAEEPAVAASNETPSVVAAAVTFPEASKRLLKEADVNNRLKDALELMRNEIFARHGYCFKKKLTREHFENKDWDIPNTADVKNDLTVIERKNITLKKKYEKYAEEYGDEFGR